MKSFFLCQLEGVKDDIAVTEIIAKYWPSGTEKLPGGIFLPADKAPDFVKVVAFSTTEKDFDLEKMENMMTQDNYEDKVEKYIKKEDKLHQKLIKTKKAAKEEARVTAGGFASAKTVSSLVGKSNTLRQEEEADKNIEKAKGKLDDFHEKNKLLQESTKYTATGKSMGGLLQFGAGTDKGEKNIYNELDTVADRKQKFVDGALDQLKDFLTELLEVAGRVGVMYIDDGSKTARANSNHNVKLEKLTAKQLMNAQNREMFVISK